MKQHFLSFLTLFVSLLSIHSYAQEPIESYAIAKKDSLRVGPAVTDFLPFISKGYTLLLPGSTTPKGVLIFLEDSEFDKKNRSARLMYEQATQHEFAVLSVSTEIPLDFYFTEASMQTAHQIIEEAFTKHQLPNRNIFFLGASLVGHRAMQYLKFISKQDLDFTLNTKGIVVCNFTMDFSRKWYQHERDIRINRINLWEPKFINYLLESFLKGTPETNPEAYYAFSPYCHADRQNRNIKLYKDYAIRAYVEPALNYKLTQQYRTLYENNTTDIVGFLAELRLIGNTETDLIVVQPGDNPSSNKSTQATWEAIDKKELMAWIKLQTQQ